MRCKASALIIFTSIFVFQVTCFAGEVSTLGMMNGWGWIKLDEGSPDTTLLGKKYYIKGITDGKELSRIFTICGDENLYRQVRNEISSTFKGITVSEMITLLDDFFVDEHHRDLPIPLVLVIECKRMNGQISAAQEKRVCGQWREILCQ